jgi:lactoylglutathione lyase
MTEIASVVLFAEQPERTIDFYRTIGVDLHDEDHGDGLVHAATDVGDVHFAVFPSPVRSGPALGWRSSGSTFVGFYVSSLDQTVASLSALGARVLEEHQVRPWGCRMIFEDPDGRAVEINQREHCEDVDRERPS